MPTYVCAVRTGTLDGETKAAVAAEITGAHHEATGAPRYYVQVLFRELAVEDQFVGGIRPQGPELWLRGDIRAGRSAEMRRRLLAGLLRGVSVASGVPEPHVWIYLNELPAENMVEFGTPLPEPGGEDAWLANLPESTQEHLREFGPPD